MIDSAGNCSCELGTRSLMRAMALAMTLLLPAACSSIAEPHPFAGRVTDDQILRLNYCIESRAKPNAFSRRFGSKQDPQEFAANVKLAIADIESFSATRLTTSDNLHATYVAACPLATDAPDTQADLLLSIELSGYGSLKSGWKKFLIGTGILEGVVQGIAVAAAAHNGWLGFGVAAEEMLSEYLTWNGVDWLLGETYAPVTLEGRLVSLGDGRTLWRHTFFVRNNNKELKALGKDVKQNKSTQLQASLHQAERKLFDRFDTYVHKEIALDR